MVPVLDGSGEPFSVAVAGWDGKIEVSVDSPQGGLASEVAALLGGQVRFRQQPLEAAGAASYDRFSDDAPFQAGGYVSPGCSLGPRIRYQNQYMMLTAGHCGAQSPYRSGLGHSIGGLYTTAYPGNAYTFGDGLLIYGGSYSPRVFSGPAEGSQAYIEGEAINWGGYPTGGKICSSGITTGQVCSWIVTQDDVQNKRPSVNMSVMKGVRNYAPSAAW